MEQNPIFIPMSEIALFPEKLRKGKEKCPLSYIDLEGKGGTLHGYCCKEIKTSEVVCYGNGLGKGETQTLPCSFDGDDSDYFLMANIMQPFRAHEYIIIVPCKDMPPIVIGNVWAEMEVQTISSSGPAGKQRSFRFVCPYSQTGTPRYGGPVEVDYCTPVELMEHLYGVKRVKL